MAVEAILDLEGIKGECQIQGFEDQIDVLSWSWGMTQSGTTHMGSGSGSGRVNVQDLTLTKYVDFASKNLIQHACTGKHIPSGTLTVRKAGGDSPVDYVVIEFEDIIVTSVQSGGSGGDDRLLETTSLNFGSFEFKITLQEATGAAGADATFGWDIAANAEK